MKRRTLRIGHDRQFLFRIVPDGCIGRSLEFDFWWRNRYAYLSLGKRYGGKFWVCCGGY